MEFKNSYYELANSFRVLAGKEQVDYSKKEYAKSNVAVIRKPWEWQKKVYQNLELHLDAAIDKVDNLAKDVELQRMRRNGMNCMSRHIRKAKLRPFSLSL